MSSTPPQTYTLRHLALLSAFGVGIALAQSLGGPSQASAQFVPVTTAANEGGQTSEAGETTPAASDALPDVETVMNQMDDLYRSTSSRSEMSMEINTTNWSRTLEMESWSQGEDTALIVIRSPAREAGTATLKTDEGLWNYAPRADRLMRIPSGMMSDGWMGSHFTNDDLVRESSASQWVASGLATMPSLVWSTTTTGPLATSRSSPQTPRRCSAAKPTCLGVTTSAHSRRIK